MKEENPTKQLAYTISFDDFMEIYEEVIKLARLRGKKPGEDIGQEFMEVAYTNKKKVKYLGKTEQDIDMLTGNLRENGLRVLNLNEELRKKNESKNN